MGIVQSATSVAGAGPELTPTSETSLVRTLTASEKNGRIGKDQNWPAEPYLRLRARFDTIRGEDSKRSSERLWARQNGFL